MALEYQCHIPRRQRRASHEAFSDLDRDLRHLRHRRPEGEILLLACDDHDAPHDNLGNAWAS